MQLDHGKKVHQIAFRCDALTQDALREACKRDGCPDLATWARTVCEASAKPFIEQRRADALMGVVAERQTLASEVIAWRHRGYSRQAIAAKTRLPYSRVDSILKEAGL